MGYPIFHSQYTAAQIEAAIGKAPRVNSEGYWEVWNIANGDYESTGVGAGVTPPTVVTQVSQMTNHGYVYIYNGIEAGYTPGYWYYWNGSAWTAGGAYQAAPVDPTLSVAGAAADAKATGDKVIPSMELFERWPTPMHDNLTNNSITQSTLTITQTRNRIQISGTASGTSVYMFAGANGSMPMWLQAGKRYIFEITGNLSALSVYMQGRTTADTSLHRMSDYYTKPGLYYWDVPADTYAMRWVAYYAKNAVIDADFTVELREVVGTQQVEDDLDASIISLVQQNGKLAKTPALSTGKYIPDTGQGDSGENTNFIRSPRLGITAPFAYAVCPGYRVQLYKWEKITDSSDTSLSNLKYLGCTRLMPNRAYIPNDKEAQYGWTYTRYYYALSITRLTDSASALTDAEKAEIADRLEVYLGYDNMEDYTKDDLTVNDPVVSALPVRAAGTGTTIKIATLNLAMYRMTNGTPLWEFPENIMLNRIWLSHAELDFLGLQEYRRNIDTPGADPAKLPSDYLYNQVLPIESETEASHRQSMRSKTIALSEWTVVSAPTTCTDVFDSARTFGYCTASVNGGTLLLVSAHSYNSHVAHTSEDIADGPIQARKEYLTQLFAKIAELKTSINWKWCIVFGDFNTSNFDGLDSDGSIIYYDENGTPDFENLLDACESNDFTPANGGVFGWFKTTYYYPLHPKCQCLDNILLSDKVMLDDVSCDVRWAKNLYTDHAPIQATVTLLD